MRNFARTTSVVLLSGALFGQSSETAPRFDIADVHATAARQSQTPRLDPGRNGRYEIKAATMVDLIRLAWGVDSDKILGGPNWLEQDRFDVIAKGSREATPEARKLMLQSLLKERFKLALHEDTKPLPDWALSVGKKLQLKEADGSGETGCKLQSGSAAPGDRPLRITINGSAITLGPGMTLQYACRNMTMAAFAEGLRGMQSTMLRTAVLDQTGLKGMWNFDLRYSFPIIAPIADTGARITLAEAMEKQLGLKLEEVPVPKPVLVVDRVERKPSENPPGVAEVLPTIPPPTEFEIADVKLAAADLRRPSRFQTQPGGRLIAENISMRFLLTQAFGVNNNDQLVGVPGWADSVRVDINAKVPEESVAGSSTDSQIVTPLLRALLAERFGLVYHTEDRPIPALTLVATKPKLKKADPDSRIYCRINPPSPKIPVGSLMMTCQNATMAKFADRLRNVAPGLNIPIQDGTGLEGGWDFNLTYSQVRPEMLNGPQRGADAGPGAAPVASDPVGGYTVFESIEKQLGLKLENTKRTMPVFVVDKLQQTPTEN